MLGGATMKKEETEHKFYLEKNRVQVI